MLLMVCSLTSFIVLHGLLLEVLEDVRPELSLQAVAEVPEQALQTVPATHTVAGQRCSPTSHTSTQPG